ncbi:MAG: BREX-3 system P-loop-containing protein BrxF [Chloroflexi bacterium]|nr:BREX-3 system P-loop-containing protein BrxF [Chloroflexota bacterium]
MPHAVVEFLAEHPDAACVLLVHPHVRVIQRVAQDLAAALGVQPLSVGKELSGALLGEPAQARPRLARAWLLATVSRLAPGPILLTDIDLLFEPAWALDPVALFRSASHSARLIVAWPGAYEQGTLAYAVPEHSAYRPWHRPDVQILDLS